MKNISLALGALSLVVCCSALAEHDMWVGRLQTEAKLADENAIQYEEAAKTSSGMEAFKKEADAQYFRKLAEFKRTLAAAVEKGDEAGIKSARRAMREHEETRTAAPVDSGNPFAPAAQEPSSTMMNPQPPSETANAAPQTVDKNELLQMKEKAGWMCNLAHETEKMAEEKRTWAKDQPRKARKQIEKYADTLDKLAQVQKSLGESMKEGDVQGMIKGQRELLQLRDELRGFNMGFMPNLGLTRPGSPSGSLMGRWRKEKRATLRMHRFPSGKSPGRTLRRRSSQ
jgi:hypothetical protein